MARAAKILIVDDEQTNRIVLDGMMVALGYQTTLAENGLSALAAVESESPDLVLLDIMMPEMDGYQVLDHLQASPATRGLPVIVISALDDVGSVARCIERGADDYLPKPFNPTVLRARVSASLEKKRLRDQEAAYREQIENYNIRLETRVREQVQQITASQMTTIFAMSKLAESRDPETGEHLERMREYCRVLAEHLCQLGEYAEEADEGFVDDIYAASPLHDIGKVGIPDRILLKPGRLTPEEFDAMKRHVCIGAETLKAVHEQHRTNQFVLTGIAIAEAHHEKWDGSGYPYGLAGRDIPLAARILALGDVYDALTSKRCYKEAFSHEKSRAIILEGRAQHFDPGVVDAFVANEEVFVGIRTRFEDSEKEIMA
jgi:putative two-component system response regulator